MAFFNEFKTFRDMQATNEYFKAAVPDYECARQIPKSPFDEASSIPLSIPNLG
jgi:hypothetical protein